MKEREYRKELWWNGDIDGDNTRYIAYHKDLAEKELENLKLQGCVVHKTWMESDGWGDGMKVVWAIVEYQGMLAKIRWADAHSKKFFRQSWTGGSYAFTLKELLEERELKAKLLREKVG